MFKLATTPIAHNVQNMNDKIEELCSLMMEQNNGINQIGERVDSVRDEASVLTSRTNIPATATTQPLVTLQQENQALHTALAVIEARVAQINPNPPRTRRWWVRRKRRR